MAQSRPEKFITVKVVPPIPVLKAKLDNWQYRDLKNIIENEYNRMLNDTVQFMKQNAPSRSGRLKNSIKIRLKTASGGKRDRRYHGRVGPDVFYAKFVSRGTAPSPGRYVAAIDKRIREGMHPGTPLHPFLQKTADQINENMGSYSKKIVSKARTRWRSM